MSGQFFQQIQQYTDKLPPIHQWNPELCGDMDCTIRHDGKWMMQGTPIGRLPLVRLYSTVLKREGEDYFLVTPVEKWRLQVEDLPFVIVELSIEHAGTPEQIIHCRSNVGDWVTIDTEHPICASQLPAIAGGASTQPLVTQVLIRDNLYARFNRNCHNELANYLDQTLDQNNNDSFSLLSAGERFEIAV